MKKLFFLIGVLMIINIDAQEQSKISYGLKIGSTFSIPFERTVEGWTMVEGHPITKNSTGIGYGIELGLTYSLNEKMAISSGFGYYSLRQKFLEKIGPTTREGCFNLGYLNLPVLFDYHVLGHFTLSAGFATSYILSASRKGTYAIDVTKLVALEPNDPALLNNLKEEFDEDVKGNYIKFDVAISTQLKYDFVLLSKISGNAFTRFNLGLVDVIENDNEKWKNYSLLVGVGIDLKKN